MATVPPGKRSKPIICVVFVVVAFIFKAYGQGHPTLLSPHSDSIAIHDGNVFVVNTPAETLDVIDAATSQVITSIPTGLDPVSVSVRPDGKEVWISKHISDSISVIDYDPESSTCLSIVATIQGIDLVAGRKWRRGSAGRNLRTRSAIESLRGNERMNDLIAVFSRYEQLCGGRFAC